MVDVQRSHYGDVTPTRDKMQRIRSTALGDGTSLVGFVIASALGAVIGKYAIRKVWGPNA